MYRVSFDRTVSAVYKFETVNLATGATTPIATISPLLLGASFNDQGQLIGYDFYTRRIVAIDTSNRAVSIVGDSGVNAVIRIENGDPDLGKLALQNGNLYAALFVEGVVAPDGSVPPTDGLYTFGASTTKVGDGGVPNTYVGLAIASNGSTMYGVAATSLYSVDLTTAALTPLGTISGTTKIDAMAFVQAVVTGNATVDANSATLNGTVYNRLSTCLRVFFSMDLTRAVRKLSRSDARRRLRSQRPRAEQR